MRTKTHKLTVDLQSGAGELDDLENDPGEMRNLFDAQEAKDVQAEMMTCINKRPDDIKPNLVLVGMA